MEKYLGKFRIKSIRAAWWDYTKDGVYFITICTKKRINYFGKIYKGNMQLSLIGALAEKYWFEIPEHSFGVELGEFQIMPNHIHGILFLNNLVSDINSKKLTSRDNLLPADENLPANKRFRNQGKNSISSIIGSYKSAVTKNARKMGYDFHWQARMWDKIVFDYQTYKSVSAYIKNNVEKWESDQLYSKD